MNYSLCQNERIIMEVNFKKTEKGGNILMFHRRKERKLTLSQMKILDDFIETAIKEIRIYYFTAIFKRCCMPHKGWKRQGKSL